MAGLGNLPADLVLHIAGMCPDALTLHELRGTNSALRKVVQGMKPVALAPRIIDLATPDAIKHWTRIIRKCKGVDEFARICRIGAWPVVRFNVVGYYSLQLQFLGRFPRIPFNTLSVAAETRFPIPDFDMLHLHVKSSDVGSACRLPTVEKLSFYNCIVHTAAVVAACRHATAISIERCDVTNGYTTHDMERVIQLRRRDDGWHAHVDGCVFRCQYLYAPLFAMCGTVHISTDSIRPVNWAHVTGVHTLHVTNCDLRIFDAPGLRQVVAVNSVFVPPSLAEWHISNPETYLFMSIVCYVNCTFTRK